MGLGHALHDREPQSSAALRARTGHIGSVESLEDIGQMLGRDAVSIVGDDQGYGILSSCEASPMKRRCALTLCSMWSSSRLNARPKVSARRIHAPR